MATATQYPETTIEPRDTIQTARPIPIQTKPKSLNLVTSPQQQITTPTKNEFQAYHILRAGFTAVPIVAGVDKFFNALVNWEAYLAPPITNQLSSMGIAPSTFMLVVGAIEIIAGLGVLLKPKFFGYVVCAWLAAIATNLFIGGVYFDIALRDIGLALGAFVLSRLAIDCEARAYPGPW